MRQCFINSTQPFFSKISSLLLCSFTSQMEPLGTLRQTQSDKVLPCFLTNFLGIVCCRNQTHVKMQRDSKRLKGSFQQTHNNAPRVYRAQPRKDAEAAHLINELVTFMNFFSQQQRKHQVRLITNTKNMYEHAETLYP